MSADRPRKSWDSASNVLRALFGGVAPHLPSHANSTEHPVTAIEAASNAAKCEPEIFSGTFVRCAINRFAHICQSHELADLSKLLQDFRENAVHSIVHYRGHVVSSSADEFHFYFRDEEVGDSTEFALAALRDIGELKVPFSLRSALARGQFLSSAGGNLIGEALAETSRALALASEGERAVILIDERHRASAAKLVRLAPFHARGAEAALLSADEPARLQDVLADSARIEDIRYFRSAHHLLAMIHWLRGGGYGADVERALRVLSLMREVPKFRDETLASELLAWEELLIVKNEDNRDDELNARFLSAALKLLENLVPRKENAARDQRLLKRALKGPDRRVIANAIEVANVFREQADPDLSERLAKHPDNRVAASAVIHAGLREITPFVIKRLRKMLTSRDPVHMASALYALGEIARHHRENHREQYDQCLEFLEMVEWIPSLARHDEPMVRRQALNAARKCGERDFVARVVSAIDARRVNRPVARDRRKSG